MTLDTTDEIIKNDSVKEEEIKGELGATLVKETVLTDVKLDDYSKPFTQDEVNYILTTAEFSRRCEVCRFFRQKNIYDPCLIVPNDISLPIVEGGFCNQFLAIPVDENPLLEVVEEVVDDLIEASNEERIKRDEEKAVSLVTRATNILRGLFKGQTQSTSELGLLDLDEPSGFKIIRTTGGPYWLGWYSNNFKDLEGDYFSEEGLDFYNKQVNEGKWPAPDLWSMHQPYLKHGKGLKTFRIGHFQFALGKFDDPTENPLADYFIKYYEEQRVTMSHGFFFDPEKYVDETFKTFRTFEVSTIKPGREANPHFTQLRLAEVNKMLKGDDRIFIADIIGEDILAQLETQAEERGKVLEEAGVTFKTQDSSVDPSATKEDEKSSIPGADLSAVLLAMQTMSVKANKIQEETVRSVNIAMKAVEQSDERLGAIETLVERTNQALLELVLPGTASKAFDTLVSENNTAAELLLERNKKQGDETVGRSFIADLAISMGDDPKNYPAKKEEGESE